jgi:hypothetical protein
VSGAFWYAQTRARRRDTQQRDAADSSTGLRRRSWMARRPATGPRRSWTRRLPPATHPSARRRSRRRTAGGGRRWDGQGQDASRTHRARLGAAARLRRVWRRLARRSGKCVRVSGSTWWWRGGARSRASSADFGHPRTCAANVQHAAARRHPGEALDRLMAPDQGNWNYRPAHVGHARAGCASAFR